MNKKLSLIFILVFSLLVQISFGQQKEHAEKLVDEGVALHDKGDYNGAIAKYDQALDIDKDNLSALAEKALSLLALKKYDQSIACCKKAIEKHPGEEALATAYVTYGNALDLQRKTDQSISIYNEGIKQFPGYYQLYFNKGVTLSQTGNYDDAIRSFQKAVMLNPNHASSHNALGRLLLMQEKRIPSLLAYCRFLIVEPQSGRAQQNLASVKKLMSANIEETGKNSVTINISPEMLGDTATGAKPKQNSFSATDLILSLEGALDFDEKHKNKSDLEKFMRKLETVCTSLGETRKDNFGFYWDYYVPYFLELKERKFIETFSYIAFASSEDPKTLKWLAEHEAEINRFYNWSKSFAWAKEK